MLSGSYRLDRRIAAAALSDVDQILMSPVGIAVPWFYSEAVRRSKGRVVMRSEAPDGRRRVRRLGETCPGSVRLTEWAIAES